MLLSPPCWSSPAVAAVEVEVATRAAAPAAAQQTTTPSPSGPPKTSPIGWRPSKRSWTAWAQKSGATVKLVAIAEDQLTTMLTSAAAANDLPDAIAALSLNGMNQLRTDDLVDPEAAKEIVDGLGADTFFPRTLELTSVDGEQIAVPSDGFSNLLFYRKDLFQAAGLPEPKTYADIQKAAKELKQGQDGRHRGRHSTRGLVHPADL